MDANALHLGIPGTVRLGIDNGAMRFIALMGDGERDRKNRLVSTLVATSLAVIPIMACTGIGIVLWMTSGSGGGSDEAVALTSLPLLIGMICIRVAMTLPLGILMGVLFGEHRIWLINLARTFALILFTIAAAFALNGGGGILELGFWYAFIYSLEYASYGLMAVRLIPWLKIDLRQFDWAILKEVMGFSMSTLTANASNVVLMRTDPFIVSLVLSLSAVTFYAVPMRIAEQLFAISKQLINVFSPLFAQLHGAGKHATVRAAYLVCTKFSLALMVGIVGPAMFYARDGLRFWIGDEFADCSSIMIILLAAAILRTIQESSANALAMTGQHAFIARISILSAVANIVFSLVLITPFGLAGVATGTLLSVAILGCVVTTFRVCRHYELDVRELVGSALFPCVAPSIVQMSLLMLLQNIVPPGGLFSLFALGCAAFLTYALAFLALSLLPSERAIAKNWAQKLSRRLITLLPIKSQQTAKPGAPHATIQEPGQ